MARPSSTSDGRRGARGGRKPKEDTRGRWLTTYADAVTLLMAFFVLLYAMSEVDVVKFTAFLEGLRVPFGNEAGDGLLPESDGLQPDVTPANPAEERPDDPDRHDVSDLDNPPIPEDLVEELEELRRLQREQHQEDGEELEEIPPEEDLIQITDDALARLERHRLAQEQLDEVEEALNTSLEAEGMELHVEMRREERGLVVSIASDDILFAPASTTINELGREVIRVVSETLDGFPNPLFVEGHTDTVPLNRNGYTNWNLSTDRAVAVLSRMIEHHGLPSDRVGAVGYGEFHPLDTNETAEGRSRNRRVDIVVLVEEVAL
ncbi:MAG: flagellar motor protein MotB [Nitriliruptoraceae bacterium]